jgi:predicted Zn-ribbon and HTH transcriptional regulator
MIRIVLGLQGSGKSASVVREMIRTPHKKYYSNIIITDKKIKNVIQITRDMIIKKEVISVNKNGKETTKLSLNADYWKNAEKGISVVIDEAHTLMDSRRAMSKVNNILNDFIALLRRVLGDSGETNSELIIITQLGRRLDVILREMCRHVLYHICEWTITCTHCGFAVRENNEKEPKLRNCPKCNGYKFKRNDFHIHVWEFKSMTDCDIWLETKIKTYYSHKVILDIEVSGFPFYNTFQWENLITDDDGDL